MANRRCLDCGQPATRTRCSTCTRTHDHARGTTTERGYGSEHQQRVLDPEHQAATHCGACGEPFTEANPKAAGHVTARRFGGGDGTIAPHCRRCNSGWRRTGL